MRSRYWKEYWSKIVGEGGKERLNLLHGNCTVTLFLLLLSLFSFALPDNIFQREN